MHLNQPQADVYVPDGSPVEAALAHTTHIAVGAHPDDLEFMSWHPILECFDDPERWFTGVTVTDGRSCPRSGPYSRYTDDQMSEVRRKEQRHAAVLGGYSAVATLMYSEQGPEIGGPELDRIAEDLEELIRAARPQVVWTHNLADRHDHHIAVVTATLRALRRLGPEYRPRCFYGCEVWGSLDWLPLDEKRTFDVSAHRNLTAALMGVYDSQITGGKRYDLATSGRKWANATYNDPHRTDEAVSLEYAMDLMPLLEEPELAPRDYVQRLIRKMANRIDERLRLLEGDSDRGSGDSG
ncbi:MAG: PIG-L family deacetylase [Armatimonadetes bacterium]|nr:PIG-L family deacetylase [Armatimonadota bacterium]